MTTYSDSHHKPRLALVKGAERLTQPSPAHAPAFSVDPDRSHLTRRGKLVLRGAGVAAIALGLLASADQAPGTEKEVTKAESIVNLERLTGSNPNAVAPIDELNGELTHLDGGIKVYASPDKSAPVRFITGEGSLKGKTINFRLAGIVEGNDANGKPNDHEIWETFEAPASLVETTPTIDPVLVVAQRMVYVNMSDLDNLPHGPYVETFYEPEMGGFANQTDGTIADAMSAQIVPLS